MSDSTANTVLAVAAVGQLVLLTVAAYVGWRQLKEAKRTREAGIRPYVGVDVETDQETPMLYLAVTNHGRSTAKEVRLQFDPELKAAWNDLRLADIRMLTHGIPSLPPGKTLRTVFDLNTMREKSSLPDRYRVTVSYHSELLGRRYENELTELDIAIPRSLLHVTKETAKRD
jgi:hypothetical protein